MRTRAPAYRRALRQERGEVSAKGAMSRGIRVIGKNGVEVEPATTLRVPWVQDLDEDEAMIGSEVGTAFTNDTGADLDVGALVVIDGDTVVTTTTPQDTRPVGVVILGAADGEEVVVQTAGVVELINVDAAVTANNYAETSGTAGAATENGAPRTGSFGRFLTSGATPRALLFGQTYLTSGGTRLWAYIIDGGAATLTTGIRPVLPVPVDCTVIAARAYADQNGSVQVDILRTTHADYDTPSTHPVAGDSIIGAGTDITISSADKYEDTSLDWDDVTLQAGDLLALNIISATTIRKVTIVLELHT